MRGHAGASLRYAKVGLRLNSDENPTALLSVFGSCYGTAGRRTGRLRERVRSYAARVRVCGCARTPFLYTCVLAVLCVVRGHEFGARRSLRAPRGH